MNLFFLNYSVQKLYVAGGYAQFKYQLFDGKRSGDLIPFIRYDIVNLSNVLNEKANEQAIKMGLNYNLPFTYKLASFHVEYARHILYGFPTIITSIDKRVNEFRLGLRVNATRYLRF